MTRGRRPRSAIAALALLACGDAPTPLAPGEIPSEAPVSIAPRAPVSRGVIGYRAAFLGPRLLLSVELGLRFELVTRRLDAARTVELNRVDLGPPDWDVTGLATAVGPRVWVSSMDGTVRGVDVERGAITATWRVGHAVTAVAATERYLAYGTDQGAVCLRRLRDGALLQCMRAHRSRVSALAAAGDVVATGSWDGSVHRYRLPSLERIAAVDVGGAINDLAIDGDRLAAAISSAPPVGDRRRSDLGGAAAVIDGAGAVRRCEGHRGPVTAVSWAAGGVLVSGSWDRTVRGWDADRAGCRPRWSRALGGHHITSLATGPPGRRAAASLWVTALDQPGLVLLDYLYAASTSTQE